MIITADDEQCRALLEILWTQSITGFALVAEDGRFLRANPAFCRLTEYNEAELKAKRFQDITDPADVMADSEMAALVASGEYQTYDMMKAYLTKSRGFLPILLRVTGLRIRGEFTYFVAEIAPLDKKATPDESSPGLKVRARRAAFWQRIRDNWTQITFALLIIAALLKGVLPQ